MLSLPIGMPGMSHTLKSLGISLPLSLCFCLSVSLSLSLSVSLSLSHTHTHTRTHKHTVSLFLSHFFSLSLSLSLSFSLSLSIAPCELIWLWFGFPFAFLSPLDSEPINANCTEKRKRAKVQRVKSKPTECSTDLKKKLFKKKSYIILSLCATRDLPLCLNSHSRQRLSCRMLD